MDENPSVAKRFRDALMPLGYDVEKDVYRGENKVYFVFGYNTIPFQFSDDGAEYEKYLIWARLKAPITVKITELVMQAKRLIADAGFPFPQSDPVGDENGQEVLFETEWVEPIGADDDV